MSSLMPLPTESTPPPPPPTEADIQSDTQPTFPPLLQQQQDGEEQPAYSSQRQFKPLRSISEAPGLMPTSHRPISLAELEKTPPFFYKFPTIVKTKHHGLLTINTASHMNSLLHWFRFHSGEYSVAERKGLVSRFDVGVETPRREEYDVLWGVLRERRERKGRRWRERRERKDKERVERERERTQAERNEREEKSVEVGGGFGVEREGESRVEEVGREGDVEMGKEKEIGKEGEEADLEMEVEVHVNTVVDE